MAIDTDKLNSFIGRFVGDLGAAVHTGMVVIGEKLGLYKALAAAPLTSVELAAKTGTDERYVREWLASQAAGGYVTYDEKTRKFGLTEEQAFALVNEDSPAYLPGAFQLALGSLAAVPRITDAFRNGAGMGWHEHDEDVFHGCEKFFRPGYAANLVTSWIPALGDVKQKLEAGARVADVGCGKGASTILMAKAFPNSRFFGFDYHDESIAGAREAARREGVAGRVTFEVAKAKEYPGKDYDLVAVFDCLHDMGDPVGAAAHVRSTLNSDGTWMIVEPFANEELKDNLNPVGRVYYSFSTLLCTPCSRSQEVGLCLGAQSGEARIREVVTKAGFGRFRRATETPFNIVYEARRYAGSASQPATFEMLPPNPRSATPAFSNTSGAATCSARVHGRRPHKRSARGWLAPREKALVGGLSDTRCSKPSAAQPPFVRHRTPPAKD